MTFIYEFDPYPLKISPQTKNITFYVISFESYSITYRQTNIQTDIQAVATKNIPTPLRGW